MINTAIITLRFESEMVDIDMEWPTNTPLKHLKPFIFDALCQLNILSAQKHKSIYIEYSGEELNETSLAECGIWEGSILFGKGVAK